MGARLRVRLGPDHYDHVDHGDLPEEEEVVLREAWRASVLQTPEGRQVTTRVLVPPSARQTACVGDYSTASGANVSTSCDSVARTWSGSRPLRSSRASRSTPSLHSLTRAWRIRYGGWETRIDFIRSPARSTVNSRYLSKRKNSSESAL